MVMIPDLGLLIEQQIEHKAVKNEVREYLGFSGVNDECQRKPWLAWRWANTDAEIPARVYRLFRRGDYEETVLLEELKAAGVRVVSTQAEVEHFTGHARGHTDGILENVPDAPKTPHLLEVKTMASSYFSKFKKQVDLIGFEMALADYSKSYWGQIHLYMGYLNLTRCLYVITNKDNEERIYARVRFDKAVFDALNAKVLDLLSSETPPEGISQNPTFFKCKYCDFSDYCHKGSPPSRTCRSCANVELHDNGVWLCGVQNGKPLNKNEQLKGCQLYHRNSNY